jgi:TusE/DsrC/DsvC family sulfur relay protein
MGTFSRGNVSVEVDDKGYMVDPQKWDRPVAEALAVSEDVASLNDDHWKLLQYLRDHYFEHGVMPMIRKLCKETRIDLKQVYALFPTGPTRGAWKIAGLPDPDTCV